VEVVVSFRSVTSNGVSSRVNLFGRTIALAASVVALAFLVACSNSNNNSTGVKCPGDTGSFSNSSLAAGSQWTYELSGVQPITGTTSTSPYREAGVFTVDGNGNITSGSDDFYQQGVGYGPLTGITGKYSITPNGTGTITLVLPNNAGSLTWAITLTGSNAFYFIEADTFANAHGHAVQQTASAFAAPSGTFAFRAHALGSVSGFSSVVGEVTVSGGNVTSGSADVLSGGVEFTTAVTGSFAAPDSTGRGSATLNYGLGAFTFNYYVIDANTVNLFETDTNNLALGRMEMQTGAGAFTNASLSGPFAFGSKGDTNVSGAGGVNTVGAIVADGAGNITSGTYDIVQDGTAGSVLSLTGTYSVTNANGRVALTLNPTGANQVSEVAYLVSPTRAFFLVNDLSKVEDGTADQQSSTSFSNSSLSGQFGFVMGGYDPTDFVDRTGPLHSDGAGNLSLAEVLNRTGVVTTPGCLAGTYSVAANGRVAANIPSLSSNLVLYMVSTDQAYLLQGDAGTEIFGGAAIQSGAVVDPPGGF
jgi:hypothetical protein